MIPLLLQIQRRIHLKKVEGKGKEYQGLAPTNFNDQSKESFSQDYQSERLVQLAAQKSYIEKLNNKILEKLDQSSAEEFVNFNT